MESGAPAAENPGPMSDSRYRAVKAYENQGWIHGRDARPLRILADAIANAVCPAPSEAEFCSRVHQALHPEG